MRYSGLPDWLARGHYTRNDVLAILHDHIPTVVSHFHGRVSAWDVVNEAIDDDSSMIPSFWLDTIGPEYIELAFRWAHEADPRARLFYNEWGVEGMHARSTVFYHLLQNLLHRGVPIHGMGFQMHVGLGNPNMVGPLPPYDAIAANMQRFAALGLELHITEMDVQIADGQGTYEERLAEQASVYQNILITALAVPSFTALVQWGVTDTYSWIPLVTGTPDAPLLFDTAYQPKPAYDALVDALTHA